MEPFGDRVTFSLPSEPSTSQAQHNLMAGVAHGWTPDQVEAPPVAVAKEFTEADKKKQLARAAALRKRGR